MPGRLRSGEVVDIDFALRRVFNKISFRPMQRQVIESALEGNDVFVQAATSFGKSLCFQLPAVVDHGITIVVSPLLALMKNQVNALTEAGVNVASLNKETPRNKKEAVLADLHSGHPYTRLLYVTPEYCALDFFRRLLKTIHGHHELSRIAVDEAHCISEWGHDFRPAFKELSWFRKNCPDVPIMALTATAPSRVRADVTKILMLDEKTLKTFHMSTVRPNLHYEVRFKNDEEDHYTDFIRWIRSVHKRRAENAARASELKALGVRADNVPGIIYTLYRKDCESLAAQLTQDGVGAKPYHAGLSPETKDDHLNGWVANKPGYDVIVATTAFGMGIDKENVRFVVHWQIPKSFEGFYQEAGRAGRDGRASICILYYGREDRDKAQLMMQRDVQRTAANRGSSNPDAQMKSRATSMQYLVSYCESTRGCRHKAICKYFGEELSQDCDFACDCCKDTKDVVRRKQNGLATEEWCSTQRESGMYGGYDEYD